MLPVITLRRVIIEVTGGIAYIAEQPNDVEVLIVDYDNGSVLRRECQSVYNGGEGYDGLCGDCADQELRTALRSEST